MASQFDDLDAFWDIGSLVPRKSAKKMPAFSEGPKMADLQTDGEIPSENDTGRLRLNFNKNSKTVTYQPTYNPLISSVSITWQENRYGFYADFRKDAVAWRKLPVSKCGFVPFFSYAPQHSQLTETQKSYYLWWRHQAENGEYLPCDYSYFWLFVYEIINLPDVIPPDQGAKLLARLWGAYHRILPRINKYMAVWLADYCLVNNVPCPHGELCAFLPVVLENASFKEFYLGGSKELSDVGVLGLLALLSEYNWQGSRYAKEHADLFSEHMPRAMGQVLHSLFENGHIFYSDNARVLTGHTAFSCALCAGDTKCVLTVYGSSFSHMKTVRATVTAAAKYAENCLRAHLSLRSRLAVPSTFLPFYRRMLDSYFEKNLPKKKKPAEPIPAYEAQYDAPAIKTDFRMAEKIEVSSWDVTRLLVTEEEEETVIPFKREEEKEDSQLSITQKDALSRLLEKGSIKNLSGSDFEQINELALASEIGDVVLEFDGEAYRIIEDYREEVRKWIS